MHGATCTWSTRADRRRRPTPTPRSPHVRRAPARGRHRRLRAGRARVRRRDRRRARRAPRARPTACSHAAVAARPRVGYGTGARVPRPVHPRGVLRVRRRPTSRPSSARFGPRSKVARARGAPALDLAAGVRVALGEAGVDALDDCGRVHRRRRRTCSRTGATARPDGRSPSRCSLERRHERVRTSPGRSATSWRRCAHAWPRPRGTPAAPPTTSRWSRCRRKQPRARGRRRAGVRSDASSARTARRSSWPRRRPWRTPQPDAGLALRREAPAQQGAEPRPVRRALALDRPDRARSRAGAPRARDAGLRAGQRGSASRKRAGAIPTRPRRWSIVSATPGVPVDGLMTVPPVDRDPRPHFAALRAARCTPRTAPALDGYELAISRPRSAKVRPAYASAARCSVLAPAAWVCDDRVSERTRRRVC